MKKTILFCICCFLSFSITAQEFPNLDLGFVNTPTNVLLDPFFSSSALPWKISHGSPSITLVTAGEVNFSKAILLTSYIDMEQCDDDNDVNTPPIRLGGQGCEGVYYEYDFKAGHKHILKCAVKSNLEVDKVYIVLANGLPEETVDNSIRGCDETYRSYDPISIDNDMKVLYQMTNFDQANWINLELEIFSTDNFSQLWFTLEDNDVNGSNVQTFDDAPSFLIGGLSIECCEEDKEYHTTEKVIFTGSSSTQHDPLPIITHVKNTIAAIADDGDIIIETDEDVTFKAGNNIDITTTGSNAFVVEPGANFTAEIEDCLCASDGNDICKNYIPPGTPPGENVGGFEYIFVPNIFDPSGQAGEANSYFSVFYGSQYPMPYNAHRVIFRVFEEGGGLFHEQIIDDPCNGIPSGILVWDGCAGDMAAASNVYTWTLELENCFAITNPVLAGDVTLVNSNPDCANLAKRSKEVKIDNGFQQNINTYRSAEYLMAFPNPLDKITTIEYILSSSTRVNLFLQSQNGRITHYLEKEKKQKAGKYQIYFDTFNLPKGLFYLILQTEQDVIQQKLVKL